MDIRKLTEGWLEQLTIVFILALVVVSVTYYSWDSSASLSQNVTLLNTTTGQSLDSATVARHNSQGDCWTIIDNKVYDLTSYIRLHPGGEQTIREACGIEATQLFNTKGGRGSHSAYAHTLLNSFFIGNFGTTLVNLGNLSLNSANNYDIPESLRQALESLPNNEVTSYTFIVRSNGRTYTVYYSNGAVRIVEGIYSFYGNQSGSSSGSSCITRSALISHSSQSNCWLLIDSNVYDVSSYISIHPGGIQVIVDNCGTDATNAFNTKGGTGGTHSSTARSLLNTYKVGAYCSNETAPTASGANISATITSPSSNQAFNSGTTSVSLNVGTNIGGTCKWSNTDQTYDSMSNSLTTSDGLSHTGTIGGLTDGSSMTAYVRCQNSSTNVMTSSQSVSFSVQQMTSISATITSPANDTMFPAGTASVPLSVSTNIGGTCKWSNTDQTYSNMGTTLTTITGTTHSGSITGLTNGNNVTVFVRCQNSSNNVMTSSSTVKIGVVNTGGNQPQVNISATIINPSNGASFPSGTTSTALNVTTNIIGTCKWSNTDQTYATMGNTMATTSGLAHGSTITGLTNGASMTAYVRCQNSSNNVMTSSQSVSFSVQSSSQVTLNISTLRQHHTLNDCWLMINLTTNVGKFYAIPGTYITNSHPGGRNAILFRCGNESTNYFVGNAGGHSHSSTARNLIGNYYIGDFGATITWP